MLGKLATFLKKARTFSVVGAFSQAAQEGSRFATRTKPSSTDHGRARNPKKRQENAQGAPSKAWPPSVLGRKLP
jgi:hypothetical protein